MAYQCLSCEEQNYHEEDSQVPIKVQLCDFHEEHGAKAKRTGERTEVPNKAVNDREVIDISTRKPTEQKTSLEERIRRVKATPSPVQMGLELQEILDMTKLPVREVAQMFDKSDMWIYQYVYLARLSKPIQQMVEDEHLKLGIAREIGRAVPLEHQMEMVQAVRKMSVVNGKKYIKKWIAERDGSEVEGKKERKTPVPSPQTEIQRNRAPGRKKSRQTKGRVSEDTVVVFLRTLGDADRSLSTLLDTPYSTLRDAFSDPQDLKMAKRHLLTSSYRLNEVLELLEAMERSRRK